MSFAVSTINTVQDYDEQVNVSGYDLVFDCFMSILGVIWKKSLRRSFELLIHSVLPMEQKR